MRNQTKENRARRILAKILAGLPGLAGWEPEERVRLWKIPPTTWSAKDTRMRCDPELLRRQLPPPQQGPPQLPLPSCLKRAAAEERRPAKSLLLLPLR